MKANARTKREQDQMQKGELAARVVGIVVLGEGSLIRKASRR